MAKFSVKKILETDAESFRGKFYLLLIDKIVIGAVIAIALFVYDRYRTAESRRQETERSSETQRFQTELVNLTNRLENERASEAAKRSDASNEIQREFERARLAKDLLPTIVDDSSNVIVRGYILRSAVLSKSIDPEAAIDLGQSLHTKGLPDDDLQRVLAVAMPSGIPAVARHGARLRDDWVRLGQDAGTVFNNVDIQNVDERLAPLIRERTAWRNVLSAHLDQFPQTNRSGLAQLIPGLYFLLQESNEPASRRLYQSPQKVVHLVGALDCLINNWGPCPEASRVIANEILSLDLTNIDDLSYAEVVLDTLVRNSVQSDKHGTWTNTTVSPLLSDTLARIAVDGTFRHRVSWIADDATPLERAKWISEDDAAIRHGSLTFRAGELLNLLKERATSAEPVLVKHLNQFCDNAQNAADENALMLLSSRYGKHSARFAVAVLGYIDAPESNAAIDRVRKLGDKLRAFEGIHWELEAIDQRQAEKKSAPNKAVNPSGGSGGF